VLRGEGGAWNGFRALAIMSAGARMFESVYFQFRKKPGGGGLPTAQNRVPLADTRFTRAALAFGPLLKHGLTQRNRTDLRAHSDGHLVATVERIFLA